MRCGAVDAVTVPPTPSRPKQRHAISVSGAFAADRKGERKAPKASTAKRRPILLQPFFCAFFLFLPSQSTLLPQAGQRRRRPTTDSNRDSSRQRTTCDRPEQARRTGQLATQTSTSFQHTTPAPTKPSKPNPAVRRASANFLSRERAFERPS